MRREVHLFVIPVFIIFLGVSFANMHPTSNDDKETPSVTKQESAKTTSAPETTDRGKLLYENHCTDCHNKYVHSRNSKKVNSIHDIRQWVIRWSRNLNLDWQNDETELVTDFLNREFYQFQE